jgi:hypothetical protein
MCVYVLVHVRTKSPFSPIFPEEGGRRSLRNLALWLGWSPDMLPQIIDLKSLSFKFFCLRYLSLVTGTPTTTEFIMQPTPSIPALWRISRPMWEEENLQFFSNWNSLVQLPRNLQYVWIHYHSDLWRMAHIRIYLCHLSFIFSKRSGLMRRKSRCQLWNRPQIHENCLSTARTSGGTNLLSLRSASVVCALHMVIGYVERKGAFALKYGSLLTLL